MRLSAGAFPPNGRPYRLYSEEDGVTWFNAEVSSIVLAAFQSFPCVIQQSHPPPKRGSGIVDTAYVMNFGGKLTSLAIGEFKRNLLNPEAWKRNVLYGDQSTFSRELRGYAYTYESPQVFAFDHKYLLMLQFRAHSVDEIRANGDVDCWILPRDNPSGTVWRYALYRLLVQGFRRSQGLLRTNPSLNGLTVETVTLYNGQPLWRVNNSLTSQPFEYTRILDPITGAFYWVDGNGTMFVDEWGNALLDTCPMWGT